MSPELELENPTINLLTVIAEDLKVVKAQLEDLRTGTVQVLQEASYAKLLAGHALQQISAVADVILPEPQGPTVEELVEVRLQELIDGGLPNVPEVIEATRQALLLEHSQPEPEKPATQPSPALDRLEEILNEQQSG